MPASNAILVIAIFFMTCNLLVPDSATRHPANTPIDAEIILSALQKNAFDKMESSLIFSPPEIPVLLRLFTLLLW